LMNAAHLVTAGASDSVRYHYWICARYM